MPLGAFPNPTTCMPAPPAFRMCLMKCYSYAAPHLSTAQRAVPAILSSGINAGPPTTYPGHALPRLPFPQSPRHGSGNAGALFEVQARTVIHSCVPSPHRIRFHCIRLSLSLCGFLVQLHGSRMAPTTACTRLYPRHAHVFYYDLLLGCPPRTRLQPAPRRKTLPMLFGGIR